MLCIASVTSGTVSLSIKATILDVDATRITNDNLAKSIQSISVGAAPVSEHVVTNLFMFHSANLS